MKILICSASNWLPERKATLERLLEQVPEATVLSSRRREHAAIWARRAWEWAEDQQDDVCILNDDVIVCPEFPKVLDAMTQAAPGRVLALHTSVPEASGIKGHWLRCYWMTGPGYVLPKGAPTKLLDFWASLPWAWNAPPGRNEDVLAIQWAWSRQEPFWSSIPAVVRHDTATKSTLGYDDHKLRSSCVDWERFPDAKLTDPEFWAQGAKAPPFVENPWAPTAQLEDVRRGLGAQDVCWQCWKRSCVVKWQGWPICGPCLGNACGLVLINTRSG